MTYINNTVMLIDEEVSGSLSNKHSSKIQDKRIWNSLRAHILSRREKNKQAEADAEVLRKKKCVEYQKIQENKLSLAQINGRLSQLRDKRNELEEERRALLNQAQNAEDASQATTLVVPTSETNCELLDSKSTVTNNINASVPNHRLASLHPQQSQHLYRQQVTANAQSGLGSPAVANSKLSPLSQRSLTIHNTTSNNTGSGSNPTLLVCSPAAINIAANNQNNNVTCQSTIAAPLSSSMTFTKFSPLYGNNAAHLLSPNTGTGNKMGRTPSPQSQTYQQPNIIPFPTSINKYQPINSGNSINNINSTVTTPIVNSINHPLTTATNSNYSVENSSRRSGREDSSQPFNRNVWINNNCNNTNKNAAQPNVSNYGSFYQPSSTAVNYCVNNGMSSSSSSLSSVNTVYSYSGPTPHPRTESSGNLMVNAVGEHGPLQIPKPVSSHHFNPGHSHPPLYMSPGIRNQGNNHAYHSKPPPHSAYSDDKLVSTTPNFYQTPGIRNVHSSNTTTVPSQSHPMGQKSHTIGYPMRHPSTQSPVSQLSVPPVQTSHSSSYNVPSCSVSGSSSKSSVSVSIADVSRYQQPSPQTPMSRHD